MIKVNWKFFLKTKPDAHQFFKEWSSWIPDSPEIYVDVADYKHVTDGTLIILVGHYFDFYLDDSQNQPGVMFSRKKIRENASLTQSLKDAVGGCLRLTDKTAIEFDSTAFQFSLNDRSIAQHNDEGFNKIKPELDKTLSKLLNQYTLEKADVDYRSRLTINIKTSVNLKDLQQKLS